MNLSELRGLDFHNVGNWPLPIKVGAIVLISVVVLGVGYWLDTQRQLAELDRARAKELDLKKTFETKQVKAASIDAYRQQMKDMELSFGALLRQLPSKTEVAELLIDVSNAGITNGLEFELFRPENEKPEEFYAELPIKIRVTGKYHEFGTFVSTVAALPRIVTLHDFSIKNVEQSAGAKGEAKPSGALIMETTAKTYRYLDESEIEARREKEAQSAPKPAKAKKGK